MNILRFIPGYTHYIYDEGKEPTFVLFVAFIIAFALARGYTRLARSRGWGSGSVGGVHLHHIVPGIILVLLGGLISFSRYSDSLLAYNICAIMFGVGAALVLDEFALVFHLKDVYWTAEGRSSVDAVVLGAMLGGLILLSSSPFQDDSDVDSSDPRFVIWTGIAISLLFAVATLLKGKYFMGVLAIFFLPIGVFGLCRLAKPYSPWAHLFYNPDKAHTPRRKAHRQRKLDRAWHRYETSRLGRFESWFIDLIGGKPRTQPPTEPAVAEAQTVNAGSRN